MRIVFLIALTGALAGCASDLPSRRGPDGPGNAALRHSDGGADAGSAHGRGQLFISPMGEPFRASQHAGAAQALWFAGADRDGDGRITEPEFQRDAMRFFVALDRGNDGEIDPDDIAYYENILVPEIRVASGGRGPSSGARGPGGRGGRGSGGGRRQGGGGGGGGGEGKGMRNDDAKTTDTVIRERLGAGRFGFFDLPEPVIAADRNLNRGVDRSEFAMAAATRFAALDRNHDGALTRGELPRAGADTWRNGSDRPSSPPTSPDREMP
ncbi:EF-hand domain-containing protein [Sphingomonas sp. PB2P12]|uniref:EF-hand domain-containing protein n=1 Tax=Sphingomonas sandaracina TaxID=3096157 RepID=UPI002FCA7682